MVTKIMTELIWILKSLTPQDIIPLLLGGILLITIIIEICLALSDDDSYEKQVSRARDMLLERSHHPLTLPENRR